MTRGKTVFRVGKVSGYRRGRVWYLCYHEQGRRCRPRVGADKDEARRLASQINAQLEVGSPTLLNFQPISIDDLQQRWLEHHDKVLRSSIQTINRYRTATEYLLRFLKESRAGSSTAHFRMQHAEDFARYLRAVQIAPNGHKNSQKRSLFDKGVKFILEACRAMFNYARKRRHLPPYSENPFSELELDRIPNEHAKPIQIFTSEQERAFLEACDDWQFPIFLTLMMTGLRPGELTHLLLPDDLDLSSGTLFVRNKPKLGWYVKTRGEREIPLVQPLTEILRYLVRDRRTGPVFLRRRFAAAGPPHLASLNPRALEREMEIRIARRQQELSVPITRFHVGATARQLWTDTGSIKTDRIRTEFMRLTKRFGAAELTSPKSLRHLFATSLQSANVDPLIRNELMGHSTRPSAESHGLGMTATYTHTRPEVRRHQLENAMQSRPCATIANARLGDRRRSPVDTLQDS